MHPATHQKTMPQHRQKPVPFNRTKTDPETAPSQPTTRPPQNTRDGRPRPPAIMQVDAPSTHRPPPGLLDPFSNGCEGLFSGGLGGPFSDGFGDLFRTVTGVWFWTALGGLFAPCNPINNDAPKRSKTSPLEQYKNGPPNRAKPTKNQTFQNTRDCRPRPPAIMKVDAPSTHRPPSGLLDPFSDGFEGLFSGGLGGPFSDGFGDLFSDGCRGLVLDGFGRSVCTLQPIKKRCPKTVKNQSPLTVQKRTPKPPQTNPQPDPPEHTRLPAQTSGYYEG